MKTSYMICAGLGKNCCTLSSFCPSFPLSSLRRKIHRLCRHVDLLGLRHGLSFKQHFKSPLEIAPIFQF